MNVTPVELIVAKRDGERLPDRAIQYLIDAYIQGDMPDYQMSAFLMAAFLNGLDDGETAAFTRSMLYSGRVLDWSHLPGVKVDKHSTGGVGDKVSLILAPIVASCGVPVPMISGRGLGHSGGTLDKLESIPGFKVDLGVEAFERQLRDLGLVMIGQTRDIAPADRPMYALRDVTGTVECIPLIASSIMSKKLAEGIDALVLDVKCGKGAFMKTEEEAMELADLLVRIGRDFGKQVVAWITNMNQPLGKAVGNWLEVRESLDCLQGGVDNDLMELTFTLAGEMLRIGRAADTFEQGVTMAREAVRSGRAFDKFKQLVDRQGGAVSVLEDPDTRAGASSTFEVCASDEDYGYVETLDAYQIGRAAVALGAGRARKEEAIDPTAGIILEKKAGSKVEAGDLLATCYTSRSVDRPSLISRVRNAFQISSAEPAAAPLLIRRIPPSGSR